MSNTISETPQNIDPGRSGVPVVNRVAYLAIWGMGCPNCAARIRNALLRVQGVSEAIIDHQDGLGQVTYHPNLVSDALLVRAVSEAGNDGHHNYVAQLIEIVEND